MEAKQTNQIRVLMFPWIAHGHVFPYLELAKNLSKKNFQISFCSTAINLSSINDALAKSSSGVSIHLVELKLPSLPGLPPQFQTTRNVPPDLLPKLLQAFQMSSSNFSSIISSLRPNMLIYDAFQPWAAKIAWSLGIPAVHFATSGATVYSFYYHHFTDGKRAFPYEAIHLREHEMKTLQAVTVSRPKDENDQESVSAFDHFNLSCEIVLMKTCRVIEGKYLDYLSTLCPKKIVPVGPLVAQDETEESHSGIMQWLSEKKPFSTVFISFGSENYMSKDQMEELARALEACDANFIWVVKFPLEVKFGIDEALPKGFPDNTRERGMIVQGWAPQAQILAHPSIGGFVSHCGASSIIESIFFGVPAIAIPLKLDQPLNAKLLVEVGVGVEVERDGNGQFSREGICNAINEVVVEKKGEDMRLRAAKLSKKMKNEEEDAINDAAEQLRQLCVKHNS